MNKSPTSAGSDTPVTRGRSGPVRYELVDKDGNKVILRDSVTGELRGLTFETAAGAAGYAKRVWPDQEQDEDRTGKGWDISVVGADR